MRSMSSEAMILIIIVLVSTIVLSLVNSVTSPVIEDNMNNTRIMMAKEIFPDADRIDGGDVFNGREQIGTMVEVSRYGYSSEIRLLVGFDTDARIKGVRVLEIEETPGLGSRIAESWFTDQFVGMDNPTALGSGIDGVTGATISSRAAVDAVNSAFDGGDN